MAQRDATLSRQLGIGQAGLFGERRQHGELGEGDAVLVQRPRHLGMQPGLSPLDQVSGPVDGVLRSA